MPAATPRIALFGGSFDPPHLGHIAIARAAADQFHLDQVLFAPAGLQPLKPGGANASFAQRLEMTELACEADPRFHPSGLDRPHADGTPNYTAESLRRLIAEHPAAAIFNLAGVDSFLTLARWRKPEQVLALAEWIIVSRPGFPLGAKAPDPDGLALTTAQRARVHTLNTVHEEVSASRLRERLQRGEACTDLLPAAVSAYIVRHGLYAGVP